MIKRKRFGCSTMVFTDLNGADMDEKEIWGVLFFGAFLGLILGIAIGASLFLT